MASFLDRSNTIAPPGFNRWLVPPAALAVHLSIGQIYGYSVFNKPLGHLLAGNVEAAPAAGDWSTVQVGLIFSVALFFLGCSSALFGKWVERVGPRRTMFTSALLFCSGFVVAAPGVASHQLWLIILGNGVLGGIGLGLGYISPVSTLISTLIRWFPDRPGLATGMAIMGFGGGALLGSPLGTTLMSYYTSSGYSNFGIVPTFLTMAGLYFVLMMFGTFLVRVPADNWAPAGWTPPVAGSGNAMISSQVVTVDQATRTPQFWFLSAVLCLIIPTLGHLGSLPLFVAALCLVVSMYGGGFATIPAYLRDLFGPLNVGAIHGRLLLAWSVAALVGPLVLNGISQAQKDAGVRPELAYDNVFYILAGLLVLGFIANWLVRPVAERHWATPEQIKQAKVTPSGARN